MRSMARFAGSALLLLAFSAAARAEVTNCTEISSVPYVVTTPGVYCLNSSLYFPGTFHGHAIKIDADDVVLDLNGHVLEGPGPDSPSNSWGVRADNGRNVVVRNGTIRRFLFGVFLGASSVAENLRLDRNMDYGLLVGPGSIVRNNLVIGTGGPSNALNGDTSAIGIDVSGSGVHVVDNEVIETVEQTGGQAYGITVHGSGAVIERNVVSNGTFGPTQSYGIFIASTKTTIVGNRLANMRNGIYFYGSSTGIYMDNTVGGAKTPFTGGSAAGATNFSF